MGVSGPSLVIESTDSMITQYGDCGQECIMYGNDGKRAVEGRSAKHPCT